MRTFVAENCRQHKIFKETEKKIVNPSIFDEFFSLKRSA